MYSSVCSTTSTTIGICCLSKIDSCNMTNYYIAEINDCVDKTCNANGNASPCEDIAGVCTCMNNKVFTSDGLSCQCKLFYTTI